MGRALVEGQKREEWQSRWGFILATVGSAVGLGNVWRFPTMVVRGGGGAFLILYLGLVLLIGIPALVMELSLGRRTNRNTLGAFSHLRPGSRWWLVGALSMLAVFVVLSFYSVIAGWSLIYLVGSTAGIFSQQGPAALTETFTRLSEHPFLPAMAAALFIGLTASVVASGVAHGIERVSKALLPAMVLLLVVLMFRSLFLEGALGGALWLIRPDPEALNLQTALAALGQVFFSFSLGMGAVITYGSYLSRGSDIPRNSLIIGFSDVGIAILAALVVVPALFALGISPEIGPGVIFVTLLGIFNTLPFPAVWASLFFLMLTFAALTSTIAMLEVLVAYLVDEKRWSRSLASTLLAVLILVAALPSALGQGVLNHIEIAGLTILDAADQLVSNLMLPVAGLMTAIFVGWVWGTGPVALELSLGSTRSRLSRLITLAIRYILPIGMAYILITGIL